MRFMQSATLTLILKGVALVTGLGVSIVVARTLGPEGRGQYALIMTIVALASNLGSFGLAASNTFFLAKDASRVKAIGFMSVYAGIVGTMLSAVLLALLYLFAPSVLKGLDLPLLVLTLMLIPLFLWGSIFSAAFLGRGDIINFNLFETAQRTLFLVLAIPLLWLMSWSLVSYLWVVVGAIGFVTLFQTVRYFSNAPAGPLVDRTLIGPAWRYGVRSYLAGLFTIVAMRIGILFVNHYLGTGSAGLYSTAQQVMELLIIVPSVLGTVLFGRISDGRSDHLTGKLIRVVVIGYLPIMVGLLLFTEPLITLLFGAQFLPATAATRILLPGSFLLGLEVILVNDLRGHGYPWKAVLIWIPVFVASSIGYIVITPVYGLEGAAWVTTASYVAVFAYIAYCYRQYSKESLFKTLVPTGEDLAALWYAVRQAVGIVQETDFTRTLYDRSPVDGEEPTKTEGIGAPR
jgi:O-antigen/teichoic acid export membrane protein